MTAREVVATLRRRWYVLALVVLCTMVGVLAVHKRTISYQACDALFVAAPPTHDNPNVYTNQQGSLDATTGVVTRAVMSSTVQDTLRSEGLTASYDAEMTNTGSNENPAYDQPTLEICSTSTDAALATATTDGATKQFQAILAARQVAQHVHADSLISVNVIATPSAQPIYGRPSQAYVGVGLLGILSGIALTMWSDPLIERIRRRRSARRRRAHAASTHS